MVQGGTTTSPPAPPEVPDAQTASAATVASAGSNGNGRIIVVAGDAALNAMLQRLAPHAKVEAQSGYLMALGDIGTGSQPAAVVGRLSAIDDPQATGRGLRRLAPQAQLVAITPAGDDAKTRDMLRAGFDEVLVEPIAADALARALLLPPPAKPVEPPTTTHSPFASSPASPGSLIDEQLASQQVFEQLLLAQRADAKIPPDPLAQRSDADLGDVDLVQHLIHKRAGFVELVMRLLRDRAELGKVRFIAQTQDAPIDPTSAAQTAVAFQGHHFGRLLAAPHTDTGQLTNWAAWLAPWLALHAQLDGLWDLALKDELTGVWNRRFFFRFLATILQRATDERFRVTLMVFDIDDFKGYNDRYGHAAGDEILRQAGVLMRSVVRGQDVVARIGGDEFAVIFWDAEGPRRPNSQHPHDVRKAAERFQKAICTHRFPKLLEEARGTLTISGGLASFPWDGRTPEDLLRQADEAAMQSKQQGKNALTFGPGAQRACQLDAQGEE